MLWNVAASCTSAGNVYAAYPFTCVRNLVFWWQYRGLVAKGTRPALVVVTVAEFTAITFSTTSQLSSEVRPVLSPPAMASRGRRVLTLTSTPFQCVYILPMLSAMV